MHIVYDAFTKPLDVTTLLFSYNYQFINQFDQRISINNGLLSDSI